MKVYLFILFLIASTSAYTQTKPDSIIRTIDSVAVRDRISVKDSIAIDTAKISVVKDTIRPVMKLPFTSDSFLYQNRLFFTFTNPVRYTISEKQWQGKEAVFYSVVGLLIIFSLIKNNFWRYLADLYGTYFRTTVRQRQVKEQLLQNPLPSLLFNLFFVVSMSLFLSLVFQHYQLAVQFPFWMLSAYLAVSIAAIYGTKYVALKFFGWVFQLPEVTNTYIFIVFSTNKILGVCLLPFTVLLAFTYGSVNDATVTLSLLLMMLLFLYRYFLSYISLNRLVNLNFFHFILYLAAFEIVPLLLINKLLFTIIREIT